MMNIFNVLSSWWHRKCKDELRKLMQEGLDSNKKIQSLNYQVATLTSQIHELKAINNYNSYELEKKIAELELQLKQKKPRPYYYKNKPKKDVKESNEK